MRLCLILLFVFAVNSQTDPQFYAYPQGFSGSSSSYSFSSSNQNSGANANNISTSTISSISSSVPPVTIFLTPGFLNQIILSPALISAEGIPVPVVGFNYSYSMNSLPNWASFSKANNSIILRPPNNWNSQSSIIVTYSDFRNNRQTLNINLAPISFSSQRSYSFIALNQIYSIPNYITIAFPTFSGLIGSNAMNILSTQAFLINAGIAPWTAKVQIVRPGGVTSGFSSSTTTISSITNGANSGNSGNSGNIRASNSLINQNNPNINIAGANTDGSVISSNSYQQYSQNSPVVGTVLPVIYQFPINGQNTSTSQFTFSNPNSQSNSQSTQSSQSTQIVSQNTAPSQNQIGSSIIATGTIPTTIISPSINQNFSNQTTTTTTTSISSGSLPPLINSNPITVVNTPVSSGNVQSSFSNQTYTTTLPQNPTIQNFNPVVISNPSSGFNNQTTTTTTITTQPLISPSVIPPIVTPPNFISTGGVNINSFNQSTTVVSPTNRTTTIVTSPTVTSPTIINPNIVYTTTNQNVPSVVIPSNNLNNPTTLVNQTTTTITTSPQIISPGFNLNNGAVVTTTPIINPTITSPTQSTTLYNQTTTTTSSSSGLPNTGFSNQNNLTALLNSLNLTIPSNLLNSDAYQINNTPSTTIIPSSTFSNTSTTSLFTTPISSSTSSSNPFLFSQNSNNPNLNLNIPAAPTLNLSQPQVISSISQPPSVSPTVNFVNPSTGTTSSLPYSFPVGTDLSTFGLSNNINSISNNLNSLGLNSSFTGINPALLSQLNTATPLN